MPKLVLCLLLWAALAAASKPSCKSHAQKRERLRAAWELWAPLDRIDWHAGVEESVLPALERAQGENFMTLTAAMELLGAPTRHRLPPTLACKLRLPALLEAAVAIFYNDLRCGLHHQFLRGDWDTLRDSVRELRDTQSAAALFLQQRTLTMAEVRCAAAKCRASYWQQHPSMFVVRASHPGPARPTPPCPHPDPCPRVMGTHRTMSTVHSCD